MAEGLLDFGRDSRQCIEGKGTVARLVAIEGVDFPGFVLTHEAEADGNFASGFDNDGEIEGVAIAFYFRHGKAEAFELLEFFLFRPLAKLLFGGGLLKVGGGLGVGVVEFSDGDAAKEVGKKVCQSARLAKEDKGENQPNQKQCAADNADTNSEVAQIRLQVFHESSRMRQTPTLFYR